MKANDIRDLATDEIETEIPKAREKLFRMRFQAKGKDLENPWLLKALKKDIARMFTVLREREQGRERRAARQAKQAGEAGQTGQAKEVAEATE